MLRIGNWNVQGLNAPGKMDILLNECKRYNIKILAVTELHWQGNNRYQLDNWDIIYSDTTDNKPENSVGVMMSRKVPVGLMSNEYLSDRLMVALFKCHSANITLLGCYAPNNRKDRPENLKSKDSFYADLNGITAHVPKHDVLIVIGYLTKYMGSGNNTWKPAIDKHTLGDINENGIRLLPYGLANNLLVGSPCFTLKNIHKYIWKHRDDVNTSRIDKTLINKEWRHSLKDVNACEAATVGSDHELIIDAPK